MRRHRWLAFLLGLLLAAGSGRSVIGQPPGAVPPGPGAMPGPMAGGMGMPSPYGPQTGGPWYMPPGNPSSYPSYYQPWPSVSPFAIDQSDLRNENGLWINDLVPRGQDRKMRLRADYIRAFVSRPDGLVGEPESQSYKNFIFPLFGTGGNLDPFIGDETTPGFNLFDPVNIDVVGKPRLKGMRLSLDILNEDGSGPSITGMWAEDDDATFNARDEIHQSRGSQRLLLTNVVLDPNFDPTDALDLARIAPFTVDEILQNNLLNLRGIPLDDGSINRLPDGSITGGIAAPYDLEFRLKFAVEQYGTGISWAGQPIYRTKYLRVNPSYGLRYTALREHFGFLGVDSGVFYGDGTVTSGDVKFHSLPNGVDDDSDGIVDNAGGTEEMGTGTFVVTNDFFSLYPVTTVLRNSVYSHMVGPEVGLNYTIAGDRVRVGGKSSFGLMANIEKIRMTGDNVFPTTRQSNANLPSAADGRPNEFSDSESHTHVSPMFEQAFYLEGPLFEYIPLMRRVGFLRNANFRLSYTVTVIGEVARPNNAILWTANPAAGLFPQIQTPERETWKSGSWDFGLNWTW